MPSGVVSTRALWELSRRHRAAGGDNDSTYYPWGFPLGEEDTLPHRGKGPRPRYPSDSKPNDASGTPHVGLRLTRELLAEIDEARGDTPRMRFIRDAIVEYLGSLKRAPK